MFFLHSKPSMDSESHKILQRGRQRTIPASTMHTDCFLNEGTLTHISICHELNCYGHFPSFITSALCGGPDLSQSTLIKALKWVGANPELLGGYTRIRMGSSSGQAPSSMPLVLSPPLLLPLTFLELSKSPFPKGYNTPSTARSWKEKPENLTPLCSEKVKCPPCWQSQW